MRIAMLCLCGLMLGQPARAEEPPVSGEVRLSLQRFEALMAAAQRTDGPQATWGRGTVSVTLPDSDGHFAQVQVDAAVKIVGAGVAELAILPAEVVLEGATLNGSEATLVRRAGAHVALVDPDEREFSVSLRYLLPVQPAADGGSLVLMALPPLPGSALTVTAPRADLGVEVWPGVNVSQNGATLSAALPAAAAAVVRWAAGGQPQRIRRTAYNVTVNEGIDAADVEAVIDVLLSAPTAEVQLVHRSVALIDVREGKELLPTRVADEWHVAQLRGVGQHEVRLRFRLPIDRTQGQPQATLVLNHAPITEVSATVPGKRTVQFDPSVPLETRTTGSEANAHTQVVGFLPALDQVIIRWTEPRPSEERLVSINTETYQLITLQEGVMRSHVHLRYQVIRGKAKELAIQLPEGVVLYKVVGEGIEDWRTFAKTDEQPRQVRVTLGREIEGDYQLQLELETEVPKGEGAALTVPVVKPIGVYRQTGVVALFDGDKVGFAPAEQNQYTKAGEDDLPVDIRQTLTEKVSQAFKHIGEPGDIRTKVATAKAREVRFDARVQTLYHVKEGALVGYASVLVELKSGRLDGVQLSFPKNVNILEVTAPSLNKHEATTVAAAGPQRKGYEIRFTRGLEGAIQIDIEFEQLLEKEAGQIALPDVRVHGAELEEGSFGIVSDPGIEVQPGQVGDLRQVPIEELPKAVRLRSPREVLLGYRYARAPWSLAIEVKSHRTVETLKAVVQAAWMITAVLDDGHIVTRALYQVRNDDRQFLRLAMPPSHKVWSVTAGGEKVKAVADEKGALAIPLAKGQTLMVEVVYEVTGDKIKFLGSVDLVAPHADLVVTGMQWLVITPAQFVLYGIDTELLDAPRDRFVAPSTEGGPLLPIDLAGTGAMAEHLFTRAVYDPAEPPPSISFSLVATPPEWVGWLLTLVALVGFVPVVRRTAGRRPFGRGGWALFAGGLVLLVGKSMVWGLVAWEGIVLVVVLLAVAVVSWIGARRKVANP